MIGLEETINTAIDAALKEIHTSLPCKVLKFDSAKQLVNVEIQIKRQLRKQDEEDIQILPPVLLEVPVHMFRAGGFAITLPINVGDTGLLIFAERSIDEWQVQNSSNVPYDSRMHSYSDATFFPTLHTDLNPIQSYSTSLEIRTESGNGKLQIQPSGKLELYKDGVGVLDTLSQALGVLGSATCTVTGGSSAGTYALDQQSEWNSLKALIDGVKI